MDSSVENDQRGATEAYLRLNRSEKTYLALEGIGGSLSQVYALPFTTQHSADDMRKAFREVVRAHPRLRSCVERTLFGHRLRIRPEGPTIDVLADQAFEVWENESTDDEAIAAHLEKLVNQPFAVERDLPFRAHFLPHAERPTLCLTLHHIAGDGRTFFAVIADLLRALVGQEIETLPIEPGGYDAALIARSPVAFIKALFAALFATFTTRRDRRRPLGLPRRPIDGFSPATMVPYKLTSNGKALVKAARARGTTVNSLVFAAFALAMRRVAPKDSEGPVRGRMSIDLRNLFPGEEGPKDGNYVSSFFVDVDADEDFDRMLPIIDARSKARIQRFQDRNMFLVGWVNEISTWIGRKLFSKLALAAKNKDRLPPQSFHFSNVGPADGLSAFGPKIDAMYAALPSADLFLGLVGFGGAQYISACYPKGEVRREHVEAFLGEVDTILDDVVTREVTPPSEAAAAGQVAAA